jgi:2-oxoglutarate ferredoxin oxidoreductase subunit beta
METTLTSKDFTSDQEVRWCPGCGDYSILKQMQTVLPELGIAPDDTVFISGIGCSSRFPYYMNTYGMHGIHGRAPGIATGLKLANPNLSVWVITGDGDGLSIGGNHLIHLLRRNVDLNVLLFNNEIYGLTKGQYSPTTELNKVTKSSPMGVVDHPFNPLALALGADSTFVARAMDRDPVHLREVLRQAAAHRGTSFVEIYQNCNVFNDGAFEIFTDKASKPLHTLFVEQGQPLVFGQGGNMGIRLDGWKPQVVHLDQGWSKDDLWVHDPYDRNKAHLLARFFSDHAAEEILPRPFGVLYQEERTTYEAAVHDQMAQAKQRKSADLNQLLAGSATWEVG